MYKKKKKSKRLKNKRFQTFIKEREEELKRTELEKKQSESLFKNHELYKYVVNSGFQIIVFDRNIGHWQIGHPDTTIFAGFLMFENDKLVVISDLGSDSLNKPSVLKSGKNDIKFFKDKISLRDFKVTIEKFRSIKVIDVKELNDEFRIHF